MEELLQAPTDGVGDAVVVSPVLASQFELKIGLLNLVTAISFHGFENDDPHSHIRRFTKITQTIKLNQVPHDIIKLILFPFSLEGAAWTWLEKEPPNSITTWNDLVSKFSNVPSLEEMMLQHMRSTEAKMQQMQNHNNQQMQQLQTQHIQMANLIGQMQETLQERPQVEPLVRLPPLSSSSNEVELDLETITDQLPSSSSSPSELPKRNPHQPPIPYPSRLNKEKLQDKFDIQVHKFLLMFKKLYFNKLGDLGKFLIPCDFPELEKCMALADLGASINLKPLSVWKKLMLPKLVPTRMTLELANRYIAYPAGIAEDVFVQVGKFTFPADFVVVDYGIDPRVPLILGRPFLRMARGLVDVYGEELILRDGDENLIFHAESTARHPYKHGNNPTPSDLVVDSLVEETDILLSHFNDSSPDYETFCFDIEEKSSGSTTSHSDLSLLEYESFHFDLSTDQLPPVDMSDFYHKELADELAHIISPPEYDRFTLILRTIKES
ncbi:reverse transcriptase domain-containing protein [Tanacetum coccineum]